MNPYFQKDSVTLYHGECREILASLQDSGESVDLVLTDPPFSRVKDDAWDRCSHAGLLKLLDGVFRGVTPMMKFNAALYCFCWPNFSDRLSMLIREHFALLGSIVWCKRHPDGKLNGMACKASLDALRVPFPETERIIMAEMKNADNVADGEAHYSNQCAKAYHHTMKPLIDYFIQAKKEAGVSTGDICDRMKALTGKRDVFARHAFSLSQWGLPTREQYEAAQTFMKIAKAGEFIGLRREYESLRREYESLRREYRPKRHNFTDLWFYQPVGPGSRDRIHNCQKPLPMLRDMIETSCRPGGLVLDPFAGSGSTGIAAIQTGRRALLIEQDERNAEKAALWLSKASSLPVTRPDASPVSTPPETPSNAPLQLCFDF